MPQFALFLGIALAYIIAQRMIRTWVIKRWMDGRISNAGCVSIFVLASGTGLGLFVIVASVLMHPSGDGWLALVIAAFFVTVVMGFGMTAMTYASTHGVREHWQSQREQMKRTKED